MTTDTRTVSGPAGTVDDVEKEFRQFITEKFHPCVMARAVMKDELYSLHDYGRMATPDSAKQMVRDIGDYLKNIERTNDSRLYSFVALFSKEEIESELDFEETMWEHLQIMHAADPAPWDASVDSDPESKNFSFSLHNQAFYIVGMHPQSSRLARRAPYPALVFNLHSQFEELRKAGIYSKIKKKIRKRDKRLQGSINPMLGDFGTNREAAQYSGRAVGPEWKCPFSFMKKLL